MLFSRHWFLLFLSLSCSLNTFITLFSTLRTLKNTKHRENVSSPLSLALEVFVNKKCGIVSGYILQGQDSQNLCFIFSRQVSILVLDYSVSGTAHVVEGMLLARSFKFFAVSTLQSTVITNWPYRRGCSASEECCFGDCITNWLRSGCLSGWAMMLGLPVHTSKLALVTMDLFKCLSSPIQCELLSLNFAWPVPILGLSQQGFL